MQLEEVEAVEVDEDNRWCSERTVSKCLWSWMSRMHST
jgi:hypothetical protein